MSIDEQLIASDVNPQETQEWREALDMLVAYNNKGYASEVLEALMAHAKHLGLEVTSMNDTGYTNTLPEALDQLPDNAELVDQLVAYNLWNVIAMVMRGQKVASELGGHLSSYASASYLFEVAFNYFLKGHQHPDGHDLVYYQGHSSPGIYARAFQEGRLSEDHLNGFRQEIFRPGVSSYPHPWLMPDFWEFPSVSLGLSPLMAIYQAQFLQYMHLRGLSQTQNRNVWLFCGDGEMDETDSLGALKIASRYKLDNLIFVINCNLQRLDGLSYSSGSVVRELANIFSGSGWNVIKVVWARGWDDLFARDTEGLLAKRLGEVVDGEYQTFTVKGGAYMREHLFGTSPELLALVKDLSDADLERLMPGGHDVAKMFTAYSSAVNHKGQPTVVLAHTIKGYALEGAAGKNVAHNTKKLSLEACASFAKKMNLPLSDEAVESLEFLRLDPESPAATFMKQQREQLGGPLPLRQVSSPALTVPELSAFDKILVGSGDREMSTTMSLNRIIAVLLKDAEFKQRIVPIFSDEARTFGMEGLFRQIGIYNPLGQVYEPEDRDQLMYYKEDQKGQLFQQGITESGCMASWIAVGTSYATTGVPMVPFFVYYSMFGYQRIGDLIWAAGDSRARGFIVGGTAGRTTLAGEGLQHQDGHNLMMFGMVPNCLSYDPTFSYEMAVIIQYGLKRMYEDQDDVFFYITAMNENYTHPAMPEGVEAGIVEGMYLFQPSTLDTDTRVQLLGSGTILREVIKAAQILEEQYQVASDIWSVTSFNELRKDSESVQRDHRLHPGQSTRESIVQRNFKDCSGPFIAATDYMKLNAEQIRHDVPGQYVVLGTDGYGRSDTREALRDFFEVNANMIAYTTLVALAKEGHFSADQLQQAQQTLKIDVDRVEPILQ
ncbi:MAG: pyruvate dehydrogenase (acetyl-transferring), homodimeric type [Legionellales bacterium]|nr:pyruvate dehydrogenase (acetyl-transferring), homodimeric type [Legionellales bacterium]